MLDPDLQVTAAEPAFCSACGLRHTRRPDWLCPRCEAPVDPEARPPAARPAPLVAPGFPVGTRVSGALMALYGAALGAAFATRPAGDPRWALLAAGGLLVALGVASMLGASLARWAAAGLAGVGTVVAVEHLLRLRLPDLVGDPLPPPIRARLGALLRPFSEVELLLVAAFLVGGLLLLVRRPGRVRLAVGVVLGAPVIVMQVVRAFTA